MHTALLATRSFACSGSGARCRYVNSTWLSRSILRSLAWGSFTLTIMSAVAKTSAGVAAISAPARTYSPSSTPMPWPAFLSTITEWLWAVSSRTLPGVRPTRFSSTLISLGTPIRMLVPLQSFVSWRLTQVSALRLARLDQALESLRRLREHAINGGGALIECAGAGPVNAVAHCQRRDAFGERQLKRENRVDRSRLQRPERSDKTHRLIAQRHHHAAVLDGAVLPPLAEASTGLRAHAQVLRVARIRVLGRPPALDVHDRVVHGRRWSSDLRVDLDQHRVGRRLLDL